MTNIKTKREVLLDFCAKNARKIAKKRKKETKMSNINDTTFLQGLIDAAKIKKEQSQAVIDDHATSSQAAIDAARAQIADLESQITGYESDIADYNTQLENPKQIEVKDGKKTKMQVDTAEVTRVETEKQATQDQLDAARVDVTTAQAEAATAEQALADGPQVNGPDYAQAQKMFGLLGHLDKLIALKTAGQTVSDAEMNTFKDHMTHLGGELEMGSEFVTKFWTDVEAGLIQLKDVGGVTPNPDPVPTTNPGERIDAFFDAAAADENSTERSELNEVNKLLVDSYTEFTLGGTDVGDIYGEGSLRGLLSKIAETNTQLADDLTARLVEEGFLPDDTDIDINQESIEFIINEINDNATGGLLVSDEYQATGREQIEALDTAIQDLNDRLNNIDDGPGNENPAVLNAEIAKLEKAKEIINTYNLGTDPGLVETSTEALDYFTASRAENDQALLDAQTRLDHLQEGFNLEPKAETLEELKEARNEVLRRTQEQDFWNRVGESSVLTEQAGNADLLALLTQRNERFDQSDETGVVRSQMAQTGTSIYEILFPSNHQDGVKGFEELGFADFKKAFNQSQATGLENLRDEWILEKETSQFPQIAQGTIDTINKQLDMVNQSQDFWTDRGDFWLNFAKQEPGITNEEVLAKIQGYAAQINDQENIADQWLSVDSDEAATHISEAKANLNEYDTRINALLQNGNEGFVGPEIERGIYDYLDSALLPENIATEGPKVDALNKLLAQRLMEATLGGTDTGDILLDYSMPLLLQDIAEIFGDNKMMYETREPDSLILTLNQSDDYSGFTGELQGFLEHKLYDTNNETQPLKPEELVALIDVINNYTGNVTYLSDESKADINTDLANLQKVQDLLEKKIELLNKVANGATIPSANETLPNVLGQVATLLFDYTGIPGSTDPAKQFTGLTGAIAKGLAEFNIYDTSTQVTIDELNAIISNIQDVKTLFDDQNIINVNADKTPRASNAFFYADDAAQSAVVDRDTLAQGIADLNTRIADVRAGDSDESLLALVTEKAKLQSVTEFTKATEEFWSYEKAFSYKEQDEEAVLAKYEEMKALETDFEEAAFGNVGEASTVTIAEFGDKIQAINDLRSSLATLRGESFNYSTPIPNPGLAKEVSMSSYKYEFYTQQSEGLASLKQEWEEELVSGANGHSPAVIQREIAKITLQKSIVDFTKDFWAEENNFYQEVLSLEIPSNKANQMNDLLNQLSDLQNQIEGWMGQLSSNNQAGRVARTKITRGRQQLLGIKAQIRGLSA